MATAFKQVKNNSRSLVATAPSPATSGTSLVVTGGTGADFPAPGNGFWATIWDAATYADPTDDANMEIVLVTARATDTFTITRAQQSTAARTVVVGDAIAVLWTAQNVDDITTAITAIETVGTNGQVIFNNSEALAGGTNLIWDNSNTRLGIGAAAATPGYTLDVAGDVNQRSGQYRIAGTVFLSNAGATTNVLLGTGVPHATIGNGGGNVAIGNGAGAALVTTGANNTIIGNGAGAAIATGLRNVAIGLDAIGSFTDNDAVAIGYQAGQGKTTAAAGVWIGRQAGGNQSANSSANVCIGYQAGYGDGGGGGQNSVFVGHLANANTGGGTLGNRWILIGAGATTSSGSFPNDVLCIGYQATATAGSQAIFGGTSNPFTDWYIGRGKTSTSQANVTVQSSDRTGTNVQGSFLTLAAGIGTGTGSKNYFKVKTPYRTSAGTGAQTQADRVIVAQDVALTDAATSLFEIALPTLTMAGGMIIWTIEASDGTDMQAYTGVTAYAAVNKAGTYTTNVVEDANNDAKATSSGTLTATWAFSNGTNKVTMQVTPSGSLTETTYRISFTIFNNTPQAITLL
jgi:hypothetical protein